MAKFSNKTLGLALSLIILLGSKPVVTQRNIDPQIQQKIDDYINNVYLEESKAPGLGLAIVQNDGDLLYTTGYGFANKATGEMNGNETRFFIGSVSKGFTALLAAKLLNEKFPELGEKVLDTPIRKLMPSVNFTMSDRFRSEQATFRDLLAHRMCMFRDDIILGPDPFDTQQDVLRRARYNHEICGFRAGFSYSNILYAVAGHLAAQLDSKSYDTAMRDLFDLLQMPNSFTALRSQNFTQMGNVGMPYYVMDDEMHLYNEDLVKRVETDSPSGSTAVTPNDMIRYMRLHLNLGSLDGRQVIPKEVMQWMRKPSNLYPGLKFKTSEDDPPFTNAFGYGLGLALASYDGWELINHGGYITPYTSQLSIYPGKNLSIFTSCNVGPQLLSQTVLHAFIYETLSGNEKAEEKVAEMGLKWKTARQSRRDEETKKKQIAFKKLLDKSKVNKTNQDEIVGLYGNGNLGDVNVTMRFREETNQEEYYVEYGRWLHGWLDNASEQLFSINVTTDIIHDAYAAGQKTYEEFYMFQNGTLDILNFNGNEYYVNGHFVLNGSLDNLPVVPWDPRSCGPEGA